MLPMTPIPPMTYEFSGPLPIRALVFASALSVVGAGLSTLSSALAWPGAFIVLGLLLLGAGVGLAVAAWLISRRQRASVTLNDDGYRVRTGAGHEQGAWAEVTKVSMTEDGSRISLTQGSGGDESTTHILRPASRLKTEAALWESLAGDIASRLDKNRGYTNRPSL